MNPPSPDPPLPDEEPPDPEAPLTGAYYWVPRPELNNVTWDLVTCHDLGVGDGASHREFWPHLLEHLAVAWGKDADVLKDRLRGHHTGLPRGRVTHPKSGHVVIHGDDAPTINWLELVKARFRLDDVEVTLEFTEHETMGGDDSKAVQAVLGISLNPRDECGISNPERRSR